MISSLITLKCTRMGVAEAKSNEESTRARKIAENTHWNNAQALRMRWVNLASRTSLPNYKFNTTDSGTRAGTAGLGNLRACSRRTEKSTRAIYKSFHLCKKCKQLLLETFIVCILAISVNAIRSYLIFLSVLHNY